MANTDISGQITDGSGNPIGSAEVYLWREDLADAGGVVASTTADSSGNFAFTAHPDGSGSSESWHVAAEDPNANVQLQSAYGVTASPPTSVNSQFNVSITGTSPSRVESGQTLTVDASLTNSGIDSDTQTITLDINNGVGQVDSSLEAAQGGGSESTTLSWAVPSGQTAQDYQATVASADDTASQTVTVIPPSLEIQHAATTYSSGDSTWTDDVGSADASLTGTSVATLSDGSEAVSFDGSDDHGLMTFPATLEGSDLQAFSIEFAAQWTTSSAVAKVVGITTSGGQKLNITPNWTGSATNVGDLNITLSDGGNTLSVSTGDQNLNDGNRHDITLVVDDASANSVTLIVDGSSVTPQFDNQGGPSSFGSWDRDIAIAARNRPSGIDQEFPIDVGAMRWHDSAISSQTINSYEF